MSKTTFHFDDGKYVIVRDNTTFTTEAYRHGELWDRSFVGDKLFHSMLNEIERLREYEKAYQEFAQAVDKVSGSYTRVDA